ncbi:hypothetical protein Taro_050485 [Colocasia esculenta]|uniref:Uncharacterized protein n=1 Tax=Colocasia esculenta TaxID=4460 RepID=A0A843XE23_COLES|nr:hypothetical protein [Colocasia esculenta]
MRSFLAKQLLQGALSSAKSGSPSATAGSWRPIPFSVLVVQMQRLSELPVYFSGKTVSGASEISKAQFCKLLKQVYLSL